MSFDPERALERLFDEYSQRAKAIRHDLGLLRDPDFAEQAQQRQNDDVLQALLAEAEAELRLVGLARERLREGHYGLCTRCGLAIAPERLQALPAAQCCLDCASKNPA